MTGELSNVGDACIVFVSLIAMVQLFLFVLTSSVGLKVTVLGIVLPIWTIPGIDPVLFDLVRYGLAVAIGGQALLGPPSTRSSLDRSRTVVVLLFAVGAITTTLSWAKMDGAGTSIGLTIVLSSVAAWLVHGPILANLRRLMLGYMVGATTSALVLIAQVGGSSNLQVLSDAGFQRATGLTPSATLVSYELAIALIFGLHARKVGWLRPSSIAITILPLALALVLSGGRGGLAGLCVGAVVAARWGLFSLKRIVTVAVGSGLVWFIAKSAGLPLNSIDRLSESGPTTDVSSGRFSLLTDAWNAFSSQPWIGVGLDSFQSSYGATPHVAPLTFAVITGVGGLLVILWIVLTLMARLLATSPKVLQMGMAGHLVSAVLIAWVMFEPLGPFAGLEGLILTLVAFAVTSPHWVLQLDQSGELLGRREGIGHRPEVALTRGGGRPHK